ncbi:MAG: hypothetical protein K1W27_00805 [Lachnospiraceae bacterium]
MSCAICITYFPTIPKFSVDVSQVKHLEGKTVVLFFPESSIRTRVTFEKGIHELGGNTILFPPEALDKKEKIQEYIKACVYRGDISG